MARIFRGDILHFWRDPGPEPMPDSWQLLEGGALLVEGGKVAGLGDFASLAAQAPGAEIVDWRGHLLMPGFVDCHIHSAQVDVIASFGTQLLDWLERYTFPAEARFADPAHGREVAEFFLNALLAAGTTTAAIYPTRHPASVEAIFAAALARRMRVIAGKVLMDRHCPENLRDGRDGGEAECRALIAAWHGRGRLGYALTPRFAPTSSPAQLAMAGRLFAEIPGLSLQSHLAENRDEIAWVARLFPEARSYLDVYDRAGLLGPGAIYGHALHIDDRDRARLAETGSAIAFCPTSNLFIGSGLFDYERARQAGIRIGLASDVGGGTSYSLLETLAEAYKVLQLQGQNLNPWRGFYLAGLAGAEALRLDSQIGNFAIGKEADLAILDLAATPILARRTGQARDWGERLFALMMLGDDRAIAATYILGEEAWRRPAKPV